MLVRVEQLALGLMLAKLLYDVGLAFVYGDPLCRPNSGARLINEYGVRIVKLSDVQDKDKLFCAQRGINFVWPTFKVGHRVVPRNVKSPVPNRPISLTQLSLKPRVFAVDNFASQEEMDEIIEFNVPRVKPSTVGYLARRESVRTSWTAFVSSAFSLSSSYTAHCWKELTPWGYFVLKLGRIHEVGKGFNSTDL